MEAEENKGITFTHHRAVLIVCKIWLFLNDLNFSTLTSKSDEPIRHLLETFCLTPQFCEIRYLDESYRMDIN